MELKFYEKGHEYRSTNGVDIEWTSVTTFIHEFVQEFNELDSAEKSSKNKKSKWFGLSVSEILQAWRNEKDRSCSMGTFYHALRENALCSVDRLETEGALVPVFKPRYIADYKLSLPQKLTNGIYPEFIVYLKSIGLCGQIDRLDIVGDTVNIIDYKSNKEIKVEGFKKWDKKRMCLVEEKMKSPLSHLSDCNLNHYNLQLSAYMYMVLKNNPKLKPGKLTIQHVLFDKEGEDKYGYPIYKKDNEGNFIVTDIVEYELPYLKEEIMSIVEHKRHMMAA